MNNVRYAAILMAIVLACAVTSCGGGGDSVSQDTSSDQSQLDNAFGSGDDSDGTVDDDTTDTTTTQSGVPIKVSTSTTTKNMTVGKYSYVTIHALGGSGDFNWTLEGELPDGLEFKNVSKKIERIDGTPSEEGTFTVTVTATDAVDETNSASVQIVLEVGGAAEIGDFKLKAPIVSSAALIPHAVDSGDCSEPLKVELVKFGTHTDMTKEEFTVPLGATNQHLSFKVSGGKAPYNVSWESKIEESYICHPENTDVFDSNWTYRHAEEGKCNSDEIGQWTRNGTWKTQKDSSHQGYTQVLFSGAFRYYDPLPISVIDERARKEKIEGGLDPVEVLTVTVKDSCQIQHTESKELRFKLDYPSSNVEDIQTSVVYQDVWGMENGSTLSAVFLNLKKMDNDSVTKKEFEQQIKNLFMYGDMASVYIRELYKQVDAHVTFDLNVLNECKSDEPCDAVADDLEFGDDFKDDPGILHSVKNIDHIILFWYGLYPESEGPCIPVSQGVCMENFIPGPYYDDMDLLSITFKTPYWEAIYDDVEGGDLFNEDITKNASVGSHDVSRIDILNSAKAETDDYDYKFRQYSRLAEYPGMSNPDSGSKSVFHRREMPEY